MMSDRRSSGSQPTLRHLEQLMAHLLDGVILIDPTGVILSANAAALRMHGVSDVADLSTTADGYAERFSLWSSCGRTLRAREYPLFRLLAGDSFPDEVVGVAPAGDDEVRWVHQVRDVTMDVDGGDPDYLALVLCDVSARFDAEARFKAMFRANPAPALIVRLCDLRIVQANPGFLELTGFTDDQLAGRPLFSLDLLGALKDADGIRKLVEGGQVVPQSEAELRVANGPRRLVLFAGQPIDVTDEDALLLTFADLEPRRQAEQALLASEQDLMAMFEMAPVAMAIARDEDGAMLHINAALRHLTGADATGTAARPLSDVVPWTNAEQQRQASADVIEHGRMRSCEARLRTASGEEVDCLMSAETITIDRADCTLWVYQDVTEHRRTELELAAAIDEVMKDASWLSRSILDKLATLRRPQPSAPMAELTQREREVLDLICDDLNDTAIANRLKVSRNTVRNHVASIYAKISVNRRSGAVLWGRERGMGSSGSKFLQGGG